jgi:hypothetical protein
MRNRLKLFLVIVVAIVTSSSATYLLVNRNGFGTPAQFDSRWEALRNPEPSIHLDTGWRDSPVTNNLTGKSSMEYATPMTTLDGPANLTGQLRVRCKDNSLDVFIVFSGFFSIRNSYWSVSRDGTILSTLNYAKAAGEGQVMFLEDAQIRYFLNLFTEDRDLRLQVRVIDGPKITMKPDMQRGAETIAKVRAECKA